MRPLGTGRPGESSMTAAAGAAGAAGWWRLPLPPGRRRRPASAGRATAPGRSAQRWLRQAGVPALLPPCGRDPPSPRPSPPPTDARLPPSRQTLSGVRWGRGGRRREGQGRGRGRAGGERERQSHIHEWGTDGKGRHREKRELAHDHLDKLPKVQVPVSVVVDLSHHARHLRAAHIRGPRGV